MINVEVKWIKKNGDKRTGETSFTRVPCVGELILESGMNGEILYKVVLVIHHKLPRDYASSPVARIFAEAET